MISFGVNIIRTSFILAIIVLAAQSCDDMHELSSAADRSHEVITTTAPDGAVRS